MLNILIPLAGKSTFDISNSNAFPKLLTDIDGKLLVERSSQPFISLPHKKKIVVAVPKTQIADYKLDKVLTLLDSSIELCTINEQTKGAVCSALLSIEHLELDQPLIISSFEQVLDIDLSHYVDKFLSKDVDAGVLTFEAIHPKWSYVKTDNQGSVFQAAEKLPISKSAIAGFYYFKTAQLFIDAAKNMIRNDVTCGELFYISHTLNEIILNEGNVISFPIPKANYFHINDQHALEHYEEHVIKSNKMRVERIRQLTSDYAKAFNACLIDDVAVFLSNEFKLTDPSISLEGKLISLEYISNLFKDYPDLKFTSKNIIIEQNMSIIEFELVLGTTTFLGTDVIQWNSSDKMVSMNAYLYEKK